MIYSIDFDFQFIHEDVQKTRQNLYMIKKKTYVCYEICWLSLFNTELVIFHYLVDVEDESLDVDRYKDSRVDNGTLDNFCHQEYGHIDNKSYMLVDIWTVHVD